MASTAPKGSLTRLSEISRIASRHGFGYLFGRRRNGGPPDSPGDRGRRLREMLDELGPTFVKFGQLLSTRPDAIPPDVIAELRKLQDEVSPFPFEQVEEVVREELGLTVEQAFLDFEEVPLAAASIGQVHRATLPDGTPVVVKVQRPTAPAQIESDLALMRSAGGVVRSRMPSLGFVDVEALIDEFARSLRQELDYEHEARNAERFRRNFAGSTDVAVPRVYRSYSSPRVLTLEHLEGTQVRDLDSERLTEDERASIARRMTDAWMTMIFRHGFFHGDPHPSNILLLEDGRIGLVDLGLAGALSDEDMVRLTRLFVDVATENVGMLPRRLADLGVRYDLRREDELRASIEELYYRYHGRQLADIDPVQLIREVFGLIYQFSLRLPTRFVILDKAIATLSGVTVELYPDFNVFEVARPYAKELLAERYSPGKVAKRARREAAELGAIARDLPYQLHDILEQMREGQFRANIDNPGVDQLDEHIDQASNRLSVALVVVGGLLGSSIIGVFAEDGPQVMGLHLLSFVGFVLSGAFGLWLVWGVFRHGRL